MTPTWLELKRHAHTAGIRDDDDLGRGALFVRPLDVLIFALMVIVMGLAIWLIAAYASAGEPCTREELRWPRHSTGTGPLWGESK